MPIVLKSGSLNLLEPSGPVQACNGIALPFTKTFSVALRLTQFSIQWVVGFFSPCVRLSGREAGHLYLSIAGDKKQWSLNSTSPYAFMTCTGTDFTFTIYYMFFVEFFRHNVVFKWQTLPFFYRKCQHP